MSKKKFSDGLESLFDESLEDAFQRDNPLLREKPEAAPAKPTKAKKSSSGKNFISDFSALFEETLQETVQEKAREINKKSANKDATKRRTRKPLSGLDMLIRRTVETSEMDFEPGTKRRVTFVFEEEKIEKLKKIARLRKSYLKEIMNELVEEYIQNFERRKGNS